MLAALIVPRVVSRTADAKRSKAATDIAELSKMVEMFRLDVGRYPTTEEGLEALRTQPSDAQNWKQYSTKEIPPDPWGFPYVYEYADQTGEGQPLIMSYGADGAPGGEGENADVNGEGAASE